MYVKKKKQRRMSVRRIVFLILLCGEVLMGRVCVRISMKGTCVTSACGKAYGLLVQLVVYFKSTVEFVSNLN
jgi:heme A synthase